MKRQIGIGALAGLALAALLLAGCDTASNSGANEDGGGTPVTPPQVNAALDGFGYVEAGKLNTPIWEFEGGKAAYKDSGFLYPYTVSADGKTLTINYADSTVYTYTISDDKEDLFAGKKKVGDTQPVNAENSLLTRNLAGRTYKNLTGEGSELTFTIKTAWSFDGKRGNEDFGGEGEPYKIDEEGIISFPYRYNLAKYTLSVDKTTLIPTKDCYYGCAYDLTLVTADEKPVTPPQVNSALNGLGYVVEGKLSTPIWEFEGGKAAHNGSDFLYPYTVSADGKTLTIIYANDTVYTYTISADKEGLSAGKKTVGNAGPVAAENPLLTRNLAGRTYKNETGEGSDLYFTVKTAWTFDGERGGAGSPWENEKYEIDEPNIIRFIITKSLKGEYTVSADKTTLTPTEGPEGCSSSYKYVLTLVDDVAEPAAE